MDGLSVMTTVPNIKTDHAPSPRIPVVYFIKSAVGHGFLPEEYVDITDTFELKRAMRAKHVSQNAEGFIRAKAFPCNFTGTLLPHD